MDTVLYNDTTQYNNLLATEKQLFKVVDKLNNLALETLGKDSINNWKELLEDTPSYFVNRYFELWGTHYPAVVNKQATYENATKVNLSELELLEKQFKHLNNQLRTYSVKINKTGIKSNLKKSDFNRYLNEDKRPSYEAYKNFLKASRNLAKFIPTANEVHLMKYGYEALSMNGLKAEINLTKFT